MGSPTVFFPTFGWRRGGGVREGEGERGSGGGGAGGVGHIFCLSGMDRGPEAPGNEMISIQIT